MTDDTVTISVDGEQLAARKGQMLIEVTDAAGIDVPRFCYHRKLSVAANCRMCLVDIEKAPKPMPACATPVMDGMTVRTRSERALRAQKAVMEFLLINHPLDCPICDQGGECELQDLSMAYGRDVSRFTERKRVVADKDIGPLIQTDMTRCIHCTRCVRFGEEIAGMPELGATGRSEHMEIGTYIEKSVDSEMSGNVIDVCPVGALTSKPFRYRARAWEMQQRATVSPHDPAGSNLHAHVFLGRVKRVVPRENEAVNEVWIPDRDRFSYEGLESPDRLETPLVRRDGEWIETDWDTALDAAATGLRRVAEARGAEALGALASPIATTEELYLLQKLVRGLGSPNVDHRLRQCDFSDQEEAPLFPALGTSIEALEALDAVLLVGSWSRKEHPMINHRLRKAARRGARIMVLNPVDWEFNLRLAERIVVTPGRMPGALAGVAAAAPAGGNDAATREVAALLASVESDPRQRAIAKHLADAQRAAVVLGPAAINHPAAAALRALAGHLATACGASLGHLAEGGNAAGAWLAGAVPHRGPGGVPAGATGLDAGAMTGESARAAYVLLGTEPEHDCAAGAGALAALGRADFVVSLTSYRTPRMDAYADVLLPAAPFTETDGTFVNAEGRWQEFEAVTKPLGEARPGWKILRVLGNRLDLDGFGHVRVRDVTREVRESVGETEPETRRAWRVPDSLPAPPNGALERVGDVPVYAVDPIVRRAPSLQRTRDARLAGIYLAPAAAERLGLAEGDTASVGQDGARVRLEVGIDARLPEGAARIPAGVEASVGLDALYGAVDVAREETP